MNGCGRLAGARLRECHPCRNQRQRAKQLAPLTGTARQIAELGRERAGESLRVFYQNPVERERLSRQMHERIRAGYRCDHHRKVDADKLASMREQRATGATLAEVAQRHGLSVATCLVYLKGTSTSKFGPRPDVDARRVLSLRRRGLSIHRIAYICKCSGPTVYARLSRSGKVRAA
jgi:DNA-binding CsgD family transcriptional regulator